MSVDKIILDGSVGGAAVTFPLWLQWTEPYIGAFMLLGGAVLLVVRLAISWRDWKKR